MSKGSGSGEKEDEKKQKQKQLKKKTSEQKSRNVASGRGERERLKWRRKRREETEKRIRMAAEAEFAKRRAELQRKEFRKRHEAYEKVIQDAESVQKAVETVIGDYRESRNAIKVQLCTDSNDFIQTQQFEKAQLIQVGDRIRISEAQLANLELELSKTRQFTNDFVQDSLQSWFVRFWKYLY